MKKVCVPFISTVAEASGRKVFELSRLRRWFGDFAVAQIEPPPAGSPDDEDRIRNLFPEAYIYTS